MKLYQITFYNPGGIFIAESSEAISEELRKDGIESEFHKFGSSDSMSKRITFRTSWYVYDRYRV